MWTKETTIWCDACEEWRRFSTGNVREARAQARREGWKAGTRGDKCPDCTEDEPDG